MTAQTIEFSSLVARTDEPAAHPHPFGQGPVSAWMRPIVGPCQADTPLSTAIGLMISANVDHLVIVDEAGLLVGEIGYRALVELVARGSYEGPHTVGALTDNAPTITAPDTPFSEALKTLDPPDVTCVVVVDEGKPVGVVSEAHLAHPTLALVAASL